MSDQQVKTNEEQSTKKINKKQIIIISTVTVIIVLSLIIGITVYYNSKSAQSTPVNPQSVKSVAEIAVDSWMSKLDNDCVDLKDIKDDIIQELSEYLAIYPTEEKIVDKILEFNEFLYDFYVNDIKHRSNSYEFFNFNAGLFYSRTVMTAEKYYETTFKNYPEMWPILIPLPEPNNGQTLILSIWNMILDKSPYKNNIIYNVESIESLLNDLQEDQILIWYTGSENAFLRDVAIRYIKFILGNDDTGRYETEKPNVDDFFAPTSLNTNLYVNLNKDQKDEFTEALKTERWFS